MCGIAGILRFDDRPIEDDRLTRLRDHLRHRGPDGDSIENVGRCALLYTRLSIIDLLSDHQPMHVAAREAHGSLTLVFNGEIYNHRALRKQLETLGHQFTSDHSDTEVILFGFRQWGTELPKRLHGMFAFAIWDQDEQRLLLCRDRAGEKPLFLRWSDDRREVSFASLVRSLVVGGEQAPEIDREAFLTFLQYGYNFRQSLLRDIEELPAAHWMTIDREGQVDCRQYWRPPPRSRTSTSLGARQAGREVLTESIASRLEADVPMGLLLSGGVSSSVVAAIAQEQLRKLGGDPLRTFTVAMPHLDYDEREDARRVADYLGAVHTEIVAEPSASLFDDLATLMSVSGEPTADSSILPTHWLCRAMRPHVQAAISGDGGDELFGGYDRYRALRLLDRHRWWLRAVPAGLIPTGRPPRLYSMRTRARRLLDAARDADPAQQYHRMIRLFDTPTIRALAGDIVPLPASDRPPMPPDWPDEANPVHAAMRWDLTHYLPFDLLRKVDRASMAVALEVRCPLLGTQVCDLAGHLPASVHMPGGRPKGLLRQLVADLLPHGTTQRAKRSFTLPIGAWFRDTLRDPLHDHLLDGTLDEIGLKRAAIEVLLEDHGSARADHAHRLLALLSLKLWRQWLRSPIMPTVAQTAPAT